jgi:hypothetical protein
LNPRPPGPQPDALPTELHSPPSYVVCRAAHLAESKSEARLARQKGFEPLTHGLEGRCSFHLSYWRESGRADLNGRPPAPKAGALPGCATPRTISNNIRRCPPQPRITAAALRIVRVTGTTRFASTPARRENRRRRGATSPSGPMTEFAGTKGKVSAQRSRTSERLPEAAV